MKEIGGYFELERPIGEEYWNKALSFNSARNALQFIIRERKIRKIYIPWYLCHAIKDASEQEHVAVEFYHIDEDFIPILDTTDEYVFVVNFFGLLSSLDLKRLERKYPNIIVDNTHAFFMNPLKGVDTIYNCRKYFGVPDGAYLISDLQMDSTIPLAKSLTRIRHIFGRYEDNAAEFYEDFLKADKEFDGSSVERMSKITHNMLRNIDYNRAKVARRTNFDYLDARLSNVNSLSNWKDDQPRDFMYPLLLENDGERIRRFLIEKKIFIPKLWPEVCDYELNNFEKNIYENMIMLPIDQRYDINDMEFLCKTLGEIL